MQCPGHNGAGMPITVAIDHDKRVVRFVLEGRITLAELFSEFDLAVVAGLMPYDKLFDLREGTLAISDDDVMVLAARSQAYGALEPRGAVAMVASNEVNRNLLWRFMNLAPGSRPLAMFDRRRDAEAWLAEQK